MQPTRRDLSRLFPALAVAAAAQAGGAVLPSKTYPFDALPVHANGANSTRPVLDGNTHTGFHLEAHFTELPPGGAPHPPHHHPHEEMIVVHQGTMEVTINGKTARLGPGSSAYVASNEEHGWRNVGTTRALYLVLAFGS